MSTGNDSEDLLNGGKDPELKVVDVEVSVSELQHRCCAKIEPGQFFLKIILEITVHNYNTN